MTDVLVFGGTAEGRELADAAASMGMVTLLSVVSEYGKRIAGEQPNLSVRCGALDEEGIFRLLEKEQPLLILDATHPHAVLATVRIQAACERAGLRCLRVVRDLGDSGGMAEKTTAQGRIFWVRNAKEAAELLSGDREPILLTTGSKELAVFAEMPELRERIFARVLPDSRVLTDCERLGVSGRQLIAMQGPFSEEMNVAMLRAVGAGWLVTKESGSRGGFTEKLNAAARCGIRAIVIQRPEAESGITAEQAREELVRFVKAVRMRADEAKEPAGPVKAGEEGSKTGAKKTEKSDRKGAGPEAEEAEKSDKKGSGSDGRRETEVTLIGMGMGGGRQLTLEAVETLKQCEAVLGAPRMLKDVKDWIMEKRREAVYLGNEVWSWLRKHPEYKRVVVVYSGDTGFYSGCGSLLRIWKEEQEKEKGDTKIRIRILPGISTLSCLCSRLGCSWEDIYPASAHARDCCPHQLLQEHPRVFLLLGGEETLGSLCGSLEQAGLGDVQVFAGIRLGYPEERIVTGRAAQLCGCEENSLAAVILERIPAGDDAKRRMPLSQEEQK